MEPLCKRYFECIFLQENSYFHFTTIAIGSGDGLVSKSQQAEPMMIQFTDAFFRATGFHWIQYTQIL